MSNQLSKALPGEFLKITTSNFTEPFWEATRNRRLVITRCRACGRYRHPPGPFCPECLSQEIDWVEPKGEGVIYSYTICRRSPFPGQAPAMLYIPIVVELPDIPGVRMVTTLVDGDPDTVSIDQKLTLGWNPLPDGTHVPIFHPA